MSYKDSSVHFQPFIAEQMSYGLIWLFEIKFNIVKEVIEMDELDEGNISEDDLRCKKTFGGRRPPVEDNSWW